MVTRSSQSAHSAQQEICIDLPGEAVQCWRSSDQLKVVLRKHRDIVFDLKINSKNIYTIESTHSDIYNARDKKIVFSKRGDVVKFADGERMHLWVTRNFKGLLLLRCEDRLIMKIDPGKVDQIKYDESPKVKPAPILVTLDSSQSNAPVSQAKKAQPQALPTAAPRPSTAPIDEECTIVCVLDGTLENAPSKVLEYFENGGKGSGLVDFDPFDVATRNWLWGQALGTLAYIRDNWEWLRASIDTKTHKGFRLVSAKIHRVNGKVRFYFSGYSRFNSVFGRGGFGPGHDRIMTIFSGLGNTSSSFAAMAKNVVGMAKGNALVNFIFGSAMSIAEWRKDANQDGYDLTASLLIALLKAVLVTLLSGVVIAILGMIIMGAAKASFSVLLVGVVMIVVSIGLGYLFDILDKKIAAGMDEDGSASGGIAELMAPHLRMAGKKISSSWDYLTKKFSSEYQEIFFEKP